MVNKAPLLHSKRTTGAISKRQQWLTNESSAVLPLNPFPSPHSHPVWTKWSHSASIHPFIYQFIYPFIHPSTFLFLLIRQKAKCRLPRELHSRTNAVVLLTAAWTRSRRPSRTCEGRWVWRSRCQIIATCVQWLQVAPFCLATAALV